jgi:hypothetical protein
MTLSAGAFGLIGVLVAGQGSPSDGVAPAGSPVASSPATGAQSATTTTTVPSWSAQPPSSTTTPTTSATRQGRTRVS